MKKLIITKVPGREIPSGQLKEINRIHLKNFKVIREKAFKQKDFSPTTTIYCLTDSADRVKAYAIVGKAPASKMAFLMWFASEKAKLGYGTQLISYIERDLKKTGATSIKVISRNRFSSAMCFYIKRDYQIIGTHLSDDNDLYINFRKKL